jgi:hypothetical protein
MYARVRFHLLVDLLPFKFLRLSLPQSALYDAFVYTCMHVTTGTFMTHDFDARLTLLYHWAIMHVVNLIRI